MDINWEFQQENARLRKENMALKNGTVGIREALRIIPILEVVPTGERRAFTSEQLRLLEEYGLDYQAMWHLSKRYESVKESFIDLLEERENEVE